MKILNWVFTLVPLCGAGGGGAECGLCLCSARVPLVHSLINHFRQKYIEKLPIPSPVDLLGGRLEVK